MLNHLARILLLGGALEGLWLLSYRLIPLRSHSTQFVALMLAIFFLCILSFQYCPIRDRRSVLCVLGFAVLFRLTLLPAAPDQSEDVYRYLWDARVASAGISPYAYPPEAAELAGLRDAKIYPMLNSKSYRTAYPPLSQALFLGAYRLFGPSVPGMKAVFSLLEFLSLLLAWKLAVSFGSGPQPLFLMAWNPFFVFEFSHSGHSDSGMMFLMLLAVYLLHRTRQAPAAAAYAGSVLVKLHPALWALLFFRRVRWKAAAVGVVVAAAGGMLYFSPGSLSAYARSLGLYFRLFEFNAGIHYLFRFIGREFFGQAWDKVTGPYLAGVLAIVALLISLRFRLRDARDVLHAGFWIMTADLCLATTVHPWYLCWAALALPILPYAFMTWWTGACFLSYLAYAYTPVFEPAWVLLVEYIPVYALMAWEIRRGRPLLPGTQPAR